jgi:hypothetical protein
MNRLLVPLHGGGSLKKWCIQLLPVALALSAIAAVLQPARDVAWGANGHRVVATIAERHLLPIARVRIRELIGPSPLARIANWADTYRGTSEGAHTASWHYVNVPPGQDYVDPPGDTTQNIIQAMRLQERILRDTTRRRDERAMALKLLVHFIADIHQPLHAGMASDRGGNRVEVRWFGEPTNLHTVWDSRLVEDQHLSYTEYVGFLDFAEPHEIAMWQASDYLMWMRESQALRDTVYALPRANEGEVPDLRWGYRDAMTPIVERRLLQAGIRLAGVLNRVLGGFPQE